jgi:hypothetical protein
MMILILLWKEILLNDDNASITSITDASSIQGIFSTFMVPAQDLQYTSEVQRHGLTIDSSYNFTDLRGGQEGAGDKQMLIAWTANPNEVGLDQVIQTLQEVTKTLQYG